MENINNNYYRLEMFMKYLKTNIQEHSEIARNSTNLVEIENSILLLQDYAEVLEELNNVINLYSEKTGYEG